MFGNVGPAAMGFVGLFFIAIYLVVPIVLIVFTARWAKRVRIALEAIAANTSAARSQGN